LTTTLERHRRAVRIAIVSATIVALIGAGVLALITLAVLGVLASAGVEQAQADVDRRTKAQMQRIHVDVAKDAWAQYDIAVKHGSPMDICVHAGLAAAAYLQAKNESAYQQWKAIERRRCAAAGLER
jgi:hypothetical protein